MSDEGRFQPRPAEYKTALDGQGGLVRVPLEGGLHDGRELYMDEREVPEEIFTTPNREPFEWWPERLRAAMSHTALGGDPANPPVRYILRVDGETREARFVADEAAGDERVPGT
jgi:hypothetical protein